MIALTLGAGEDAISGSKDPKLGIIAVRVKCWAPDLGTALMGDLPSIGISGLIENQPRTFSSLAAGTQGGYNVLATLEGHLTPNSADGVEYSFEGTTSEDPIETHPELNTLLEVYGGAENAEGKAKWEKTLPDGTGFEFVVPGFESFGNTGLDGSSGAGRRNPMHGVESYLVPGLTWTRKSASVNLPATLIRSLGTIDQPPGNPPELSGNRNWLKIRVRGTWRGNIWQLEETWLLSGPDGWVREMYRYQ